MKSVGKAFLVNQGCYLVDSEVRVGQLGLHPFGDKETHVVIDVCGIGLKAFSLTRGQAEDYQTPTIRENFSYQFEVNVLRGIEVKISRSDFRNGFVSSCNYNYILAPMRLIAPYEIPDGVGLIEFNRHKFSCEIDDEADEYQSNRIFKIEGLRVVKRPKFRRVPQYQIDNVNARIARRSTNGNHIKILEEIRKCAD